MQGSVLKEPAEGASEKFAKAVRVGPSYAVILTACTRGRLMVRSMVRFHHGRCLHQNSTVQAMLGLDLWYERVERSVPSYSVIFTACTWGRLMLTVLMVKFDGRWKGAPSQTE